MKKKSNLTAPFLKKITFEIPEGEEVGGFPFSIPLFRKNFTVNFTKPIIIITGDNGSGKSTFIETIAHTCGFNIQGGSRDHAYATHEREPLNHLNILSRLMRFSWLPKVSQGFFMRSETFFNFLEYLKDPKLGMGEKEFKYYGGDLLTKSHGEGFLSLFKNRFSNGGIYLLDEPEAALSPQWQIEFLKVLKSFENRKDTQVVMITHSPLLMSYPGAEVYHVGAKGLVVIEAEETEHFKLMQRFYRNPQLFIKEVLLDE